MARQAQRQSIVYRRAQFWVEAIIFDVVGMQWFLSRAAHAAFMSISLEYSASPFCEQWKKLSAALDTTAEEEEPA